MQTPAETKPGHYRRGRTDCRREGMRGEGGSQSVHRWGSAGSSPLRRPNHPLHSGTPGNAQAGSWQSFPGPTLTEKKGTREATRKTVNLYVQGAARVEGRDVDCWIWVESREAAQPRVLERLCYHLEGGPGSFPLGTPSQQPVQEKLT